MLLNFWQRLVAFQEKVQLCSVQLQLLLDDHDRHVERKHQFVHLEDTQAHVLVNVECKFVDNRPKTCFKYWVFLGVSQGVVENDQIWSKGVFIHLTDSRKSSHSEEQYGSSDGHWCVCLTGLLNLLRGDLPFFDIFCYLNWHSLRRLQSLNQRFVLQQTAATLTQTVQQVIFCLFQFLAVDTHLMDQLFSLSFFLWLLKADHHVQKLVPQTHQSHSKVNNHRLTHDLWSVLWIWKFRCEIQLERLVVIDKVIRQLDVLLACPIHNVLLEQGIQRWVQFFIYVLEKACSSSFYRVLQVFDKRVRAFVHVKGLEHGSFVLFLNPIGCLQLRIDAKRPSCGFCG